MSVLHKKTLLVLAGITVGLAAHAQQTRQLIKPADATSITAFAGPSIVMPVIPGNLCTADNNNCATMAGVQQGIYGGSIVIPQQTVAPSSFGFSLTSGTGPGSYSILGVCVQGYSGPSSYVGTHNTWTRDVCPAGYGAILSQWDQYSGS